MFVKNYTKISATSWQDTKNGKTFSHNQYAGSRFGKDHFYIDKNLMKERIRIFKSNYNMKNENYIIENEDLTVLQAETVPDLSNKKVLILGGGPTTNLINWQNIDYDYIFACNNFYKNKNLNNIKIDFLSFAPFMDLTENNQELMQYITKHQPSIGIEPEHSKPTEIQQLGPFLQKHKKSCIIYQTKYCSPIGLSTRQTVLSSVLGAAEVHMVGLDLFSDTTTDHAYEKQKSLPRWRVVYGQAFQERQIIIFWDYLKELQQKYGTKFYNLSEGLKESHMTFASKCFSPLPERIKKVVQ